MNSKPEWGAYSVPRITVHQDKDDPRTLSGSKETLGRSRVRNEPDEERPPNHLPVHVPLPGCERGLNSHAQILAFRFDNHG